MERGQQILLENFKLGDRNILRNNMVSYHFDEKNRENRHNEYFMSGNIFRETLRFFENDEIRKVESTSYSREGEITTKSINLYDYEYNEIEYSNYHANGSLLYRNTTSIGSDDSSEIAQKGRSGNKINSTKNDAGNVKKRDTYK